MEECPFTPSLVFELDIDYVPEEYREMFLSWVKNYNESVTLPENNYLNLKEYIECVIPKYRYDMVERFSPEPFKPNKIHLLMEKRETLPKKGKTNVLQKEYAEFDKALIEEIYKEHFQETLKAANTKESRTQLIKDIKRHIKKCIQYNYNNIPKITKEFNKELKEARELREKVYKEQTYKTEEDKDIESFLSSMRNESK